MYENPTREANINGLGQIRLPIKGYAEIRLDSRQTTIVAEVGIVKGLGSAAILGTNVTAADGDPDQRLSRTPRYIVIAGERVPVFKGKDELGFGSCALVLPDDAEPIRIPPNHGQVVALVPKTRIQWYGEEPATPSLGVVDPVVVDDGGPPCHVEAGRLPVSSDSSRFSVFLTNRSDEDRFFSAGQVLATLSPAGDELTPEEIASLPSEKTFLRDDPIGMMTVPAPGRAPPAQDAASSSSPHVPYGKPVAPWANAPRPQVSRRAPVAPGGIPYGRAVPPPAPSQPPPYGLPASRTEPGSGSPYTDQRTRSPWLPTNAQVRGETLPPSSQLPAQPQEDNPHAHIEELIQQTRANIDDNRLKERAEGFLRRNADCFSKGKHDLGRCRTTFHTIEIADGKRPVKAGLVRKQNPKW